MSNLLIIGAGGHGKVVAEAAELSGEWDTISFLDDRTDVTSVLGFKIVGTLDEYRNFVTDYSNTIVAFGDNEKRLEWIKKLIHAGFDVPIIVHPHASVSKYSSIQLGTVILSRAVVNTGTTLGTGCIVNVSACVDHDCEIGDGVHIGSGAIVRSMCHIESLAVIGAASYVKSSTYLKERFVLPEGKTVGSNGIL
ncbi:PglD-related sugar-binding protein [Massilibacterium senegalense]|uniref:PglD-related sugar-binding protein n=1 Tax=Massilibacterium senegalense TaxID=1632858 RepID=UPI0007865B5B|nr:hypothetical protein [Massilibacterium senegalense]